LTLILLPVAISLDLLLGVVAIEFLTLRACFKSSLATGDIFPRYDFHDFRKLVLFSFHLLIQEIKWIFLMIRKISGWNGQIFVYFETVVLVHLLAVAVHPAILGSQRQSCVKPSCFFGDDFWTLACHYFSALNFLYLLLEHRRRNQATKEKKQSHTPNEVLPEKSFKRPCSEILPLDLLRLIDFLYGEPFLVKQLFLDLFTLLALWPERPQKPSFEP
jgi:hypothetical protein